MSSLSATQITPAQGARAPSRRVLAACCGAHFLHDGFSDLLYVLFPVWQSLLGLSLAEIGFLKTLYSGSMAAFQVPAGLLAERIGERGLLAIGTAVAAGGFLLAGLSGGVFGLMLCLALGGAGSSVQHPLSSSLTARAYEGRNLRAALGTYNFSGDLGKVALPAATAWLVAGWDWRVATTLIGAAGLVAAIAVFGALSGVGGRRTKEISGDVATAAVRNLPPDLARQGFLALSAIGVIDGAARTGFLTFLPFLLTARGASLPTVGLALSLIFAGGAGGKFICGVIAARAGILRTVILTEGGTAIGILAVLFTDLSTSIALLPLIGIALNGTSSVLYGTVAEIVPAERRARAFAVFYTCTIGAGAVSPALYGLLGDHIGTTPSMMAVSAMVLLVLPLTVFLRPVLRHGQR
jgi:FSR family fosmidomycin resistance protein-like MFS transporter